jgi:hypothetical protein
MCLDLKEARSGSECLPKTAARSWRLLVGGLVGQVKGGESWDGVLGARVLREGKMVDGNYLGTELCQNARPHYLQLDESHICMW